MKIDKKHGDQQRIHVVACTNRENGE